MATPEADLTPERKAWLCHVAIHSATNGVSAGEALDACLDAAVIAVLGHWSKYAKPHEVGELPVGTVAYLNGMNETERQYVRVMAVMQIRSAVKASDNFNS